MKPDAADRAIKRARVRAILDERNVETVLLVSQPAVSWYLDGARTHVGIAAPPIVQIEAGGARDIVYVTSNESARLGLEELPADVEVRVRPWFADVETAAVSESGLETELRAARQQFLPAETARYRVLCGLAAEVLTDVLADARPDDSELEVAARIAARIIHEGADPIVLLVAGDERIAFRHPLPTHGLLGRRAMVVLCARKWGLIANVTRWVRFSAEDPTDGRLNSNISRVEADFFEATVEGARLSDVLTAAADSYPRHGFATDEWRNHHQGGPAGYAGRDPRVSPGVRDEIVQGQPFAWNPSAFGAKIEDTVLLTAAGIEPISVDPRWPTETVNGISRPVTLEP
jgi:Metallopeptidase family M24